MNDSKDLSSVLLNLFSGSEKRIALRLRGFLGEVGDLETKKYYRASQQDTRNCKEK